MTATASDRQQLAGRDRANRRAFKLTPELQAKIRDLQSDLAAFCTDMHDQWDSRSERWQDSDPGVQASAWIKNLDNLSDDLDNVETEPES